MKTIKDLKEKLLSAKWIYAEYKNLQETHIYVNLDGDKIYAQYVCVTEGGQMFDCNVFAEAISAKGFFHLFTNSDWFTISLSYKLLTMKTTTELNYNGYTITIIGEYNAPERGSRDRWGAPLEPDCDAYFDIISTHIGDVEFKDNEKLAWFLQTSELYIDELMQEALQEAYEDELEAYHEAQAEAHYENLRCQYYD